MRVLEFEAKALLAGRGLVAPRGVVVRSAAEAENAARELGLPVVVKAQVAAGGRMKAGGVRFADTPAQAAEIAAELFARPVRNLQVHHLLVEEKLPPGEEVFVGVTYDRAARRAVLVASRAGGIEVETQGQMVRRHISSRTHTPEYVGREAAAELGFSGEALVALGSVINEVIRCFFDWDALLLEINPLMLGADRRWRVADAHLELDDDALYRQESVLVQVPVSRTETEPRSELERRGAEIDRADHRGVAGRLIPFGGNLGLLIGGGGASLTIMDAVLDAGLKPANYCEMGGNPSVSKIQALTQLVLSQPGVERLAVIMNVVSNTRVDLVARGVILGVLGLGREPREVITVFRIPGSWEAEGQAILQHYGVRYFGRETGLDAVVEAIR